jgi:CDP-glycerol glycerophosphotransferase (TagB/SpsB family)
MMSRVRSLATKLGRAAAGFPLYLFSMLVPRTRRLWVFGAWYGKRYSDNSRYLFEYVRREHPDIRAVWLSRDFAIVRDLRASDHEAYLANSWMGFWLSCRAGLAVLASSVSDVNHIGAAGARHLQLWHGTPLKKIKRDDDLNEAERGGTVRRVAARAWRRVAPFLVERYDMTVAPSLEVQRRMCSAFGLEPARAPITGWPRSDAVLAATPPSVPLVERLAKRAGAPRRLVCYAPTFRNDRTLLPEFWATLDPAKLSHVLERHDAVFVVKLHYVDRDALATRFTTSDRVVLANDEEVPDLTALLPHIDVLVTDYSSVYIDYLLLDRPILFAPFDLERYVATERGLYESYDGATPGPKSKDWPQLIRDLDCALQGFDPHRMERQALRRRFSAFVDDRNCERVMCEALRLAGLPANQSSSVVSATHLS